MKHWQKQQFFLYICVCVCVCVCVCDVSQQQLSNASVPVSATQARRQTDHHIPAGTQSEADCRYNTSISLSGLRVCDGEMLFRFVRQQQQLSERRLDCWSTGKSFWQWWQQLFYKIKRSVAWENHNRVLFRRKVSSQLLILSVLFLFDIAIKNETTRLGKFMQHLVKQIKSDTSLFAVEETAVSWIWISAVERPPSVMKSFFLCSWKGQIKSAGSLLLPS